MYQQQSKVSCDKYAGISNLLLNWSSTFKEDTSAPNLDAVSSSKTKTPSSLLPLDLVQRLKPYH